MLLGVLSTRLAIIHTAVVSKRLAPSQNVRPVVISRPVRFIGRRRLKVTAFCPDAVSGFCYVCSRRRDGRGQNTERHHLVLPLRDPHSSSIEESSLGFGCRKWYCFGIRCYWSMRTNLAIKRLFVCKITLS